MVWTHNSLVLGGAALGLEGRSGYGGHPLLCRVTWELWHAGPRVAGGTGAHQLILHSGTEPRSDLSLSAQEPLGHPIPSVRERQAP